PPPPPTLLPYTTLFRSPDVQREALLLEVDQGAPGLQGEAAGGVRPVDQHQGRALQAQPAQRAEEALAGGVAALVTTGDLRGHQCLVRVHAAVAQALAQRGLVAVLGGGVDEPVARTQRLADRAGALDALHAGGAEADQREGG